jgi:hypothetical protein
VFDESYIDWDNINAEILHMIKRMINSVQRWLGCCTTHSSME